MCVCLIVCGLEASTGGGLGQIWAAAPQKERQEKLRYCKVILRRLRKNFVAIESNNYYIFLCVRVALVIRHAKHMRRIIW